MSGSTLETSLTQALTHGTSAMASMLRTSRVRLGEVSSVKGGIAEVPSVDKDIDEILSVKPSVGNVPSD